MKTVLVFGTFDGLHPGHVYFLKKAKKFGDRLVVSVARDSFVNNFKRKDPKRSETERIRDLRKSGLADEVFLSDRETGTYQLVSELKPEVICFGHDQDLLREDFLEWRDKHKMNIETHTIDKYEIYQ